MNFPIPADQIEETYSCDDTIIEILNLMFKQQEVVEVRRIYILKPDECDIAKTIIEAFHVDELYKYELEICYAHDPAEWRIVGKPERTAIT